MEVILADFAPIWTYIINFVMLYIQTAYANC